MNQTRNNKLLLVVIIIFAISGIFVLIGLFPAQGNCYIECSPVIGITNYQFFAALLKNTVNDYFITRLKTYFLKKINLEFMPGNFAREIMVSLESATDFSSITNGIVDKGLVRQIDYLKQKMSPKAFRKNLNSAVTAAVKKSLLQKGIDRRQVEILVGDYEKQFLNSRQVFEIYVDRVLKSQEMARGFTEECARFVSEMTDLGGNIDVAERVQKKQKTGVISNTMEMLKECKEHMANGLKNINTIAGIDVGDAIGGMFFDVNSRYLRERLEKVFNPDGTVLLSNEEIEKIVGSSNNVALSAVQDYFTRTISDLNGLGIQTNAELNRTMKKAIGKADSVISGTMLEEREDLISVNRFYTKVENKVNAMMDNYKQFEAVATENNLISILDNADIEKITFLLANRNSSALQRRIAVKCFIVALESRDVATVIKTKLSKFDPESIDRGYDDMAWKDLARFNYYLLFLHNQKLKLMALQAMAESLNTEDPEIARYVENGGPQK